MTLKLSFLSKEALERLEDEEGTTTRLEDDKRNLETLRDQLQDKIEDNTQNIAKVKTYLFLKTSCWAALIGKHSPFFINIP